MALTGHDIDDDIAAVVARMFDAERDEIVALHVAHSREARATYGHLESTDTAARGADLSAMTSDRAVATPTEGAERATERLSAEFSDHVKLLTSKFLPGFSIEQDLVIEDDPAKAIASAVDRHSADAITMGQRSKRSRLAAALLGSETEQVLRHVSVPVTIVKEGTTSTAGS